MRPKVTHVYLESVHVDLKNLQIKIRPRQRVLLFTPFHQILVHQKMYMLVICILFRLCVKYAPLDCHFLPSSVLKLITPRRILENFRSLTFYNQLRVPESLSALWLRKNYGVSGQNNGKLAMTVKNEARAAGP